MYLITLPIQIKFSCHHLVTQLEHVDVSVHTAVTLSGHVTSLLKSLYGCLAETLQYEHFQYAGTFESCHSLKGAGLYEQHYSSDAINFK